MDEYSTLTDDEIDAKAFKLIPWIGELEVLAFRLGYKQAIVDTRDNEIEHIKKELADAKS